MPSICFVALHTYPVLNPAHGKGYVGGESVQITLLARAFRDLGYKVFLAERDYGQPDEEVIDGITVLKTCDWKAGLPVLRFFHPRMTSLLRVLHRADADIYYQSAAGPLTGFGAWVARKRGKHFVFRVAHDLDCVPGKQLIRLWRDRKIYDWGLRRAHMIFAQSERQQRMLKTNYGLESRLMNMTVEMPSAVERDLPRDIDVLWVNNMRRFKRPDRCLELAKLIPECRVVMVGGPTTADKGLYEEIRSQAKDLPNVECAGPVPYNEVNQYYARAKVFVNTSDSEGFPNSFLQAWIRRVPVISFFDPDGLIAGQGLGSVPESMEDMAGEVRRAVKEYDPDSELRRRVFDFANDNYNPDVIARRYDACFRELQGRNA